MQVQSHEPEDGGIEDEHLEEQRREEDAAVLRQLEEPRDEVRPPEGRDERPAHLARARLTRG